MNQLHEREHTVALIGGLGKMAVPTKRVFQEAGYPDPLISDTADLTTISAREAIRQARIVFFSVKPIENIGTIIRETGDVFDANHIVLDNATIKNPLREPYQLLDQKGVSITSTHPLCKEDQPLSGQNVLIAPFGQQPQEATQIAEHVYGNAGMVLVYVDFYTHDATMRFNQALAHLANRASGEVQVELGTDPEALDRISTANSRLFAFSNWRTLVQDPEISATILEDALQSPDGIIIAQKYIQALSRLVEAAQTKGALAERFRETIAKLDPTGKIRAGMNQKSIQVLEYLANLSRHSITIEIYGDKPGLLLPALQVLKEHEINMNAFAPHEIETGWQFGIGIASGEITPQVQEELTQLGVRIIGLTVPE